MTVPPRSDRSATKFNDRCPQCREDQPIVFVMPKDGGNGPEHTWTCVSCGAPLQPEIRYIDRPPNVKEVD
jgi:hypothetical protein